jgi:hypothetical protein
MKKLLFIICIAAFSGSVFAQETSATVKFASLNTDTQIDALFGKRALLLANDENTREVDYELAKLGVRFPAKLNVSFTATSINIAFPILENPNAPYMAEKLEKIKTEMPELEIIGVDATYCFASLKKNTSDKRVEKLVSEFFYDGYFVSAHSKVQLEALLD